MACAVVVDTYDLKALVFNRSEGRGVERTR
jgi:hypothetical protein